MFAISYLVGKKYGTWATGRQRFTTTEAAEREIKSAQAAEHMCDASKFVRRVVRA